MKNYVVVRICNKIDGTTAIPVSSFERKDEAQIEYYRLCGYAVDSTHITDCVVLMGKDGFPLERKMFNHGGEEHPEQSEE